MTKNRRTLVEGPQEPRQDFEAQANSIPRLAKLRTLELNADYNPLSYFPLSLIPWTQVMFLLIKGQQTGIPRINVVDYYDEYVYATHTRIQLPSVVSHITFRKRDDKISCTPNNILLRDDFTCQYSGIRYPASQLNMDHVIPKSKGGPFTWDNIVAAHYKINEAKGNRTPAEAGLRLIRKPYAPSVYELRDKGRKYPPAYIHESWKPFLQWNLPEAA